MSKATELIGSVIPEEQAAERRVPVMLTPNEAVLAVQAVQHFMGVSHRMSREAAEILRRAEQQLRSAYESTERGARSKV